MSTFNRRDTIKSLVTLSITSKEETASDTIPAGLRTIAEVQNVPGTDPVLIPQNGKSPFTVLELMHKTYHLHPWERLIQHMAYSTLTVHPNAQSTEYGLFNYAIGQFDSSGHYTTITRTNQQQPNRFPPPISMFVRRILCFATPATDLQDYLNFAPSYTFQLRIDDANVAEFPLASLLVIGDPETIVDMPDKIATVYNRRPVNIAPNASYRLEYAAKIQSMQHFSVRLIGTPVPLKKPVHIFAGLDGPMTTSLS